MFTDYTLNQIANILADNPLPEGEEFVDALDDFAGPPSEGFEYTEEQNRQYAAWLARQQAKQQPKPLTEEEKRAAAKAKVVAFYTEENIRNERSLWEE